MAQQIKKKFLDPELISQVESLETNLANEIIARESGDTSTLDAAKLYTDEQIAAIPSVDLSAYETIVNVDAKIAQEVLDRNSAIENAIDLEEQARELADSNLQTQIDTEKSRVDAILLASEADKDSFAEIVALINSVDTENDTAFASYVLSNDAEVSSIKGRLDTIEPKVSTLESEMDLAQSDIVSLDERLVKEEEINKFLTASLYNDSAAVYADGDKGMEDPSSLTRDGWYYQNAALGDKINWYFYDGTQQAVTLGDFSAYAIMTFDSSAAPILGVYTAPTGTNDVIPGFAHSRVAYSAMSPTPVVGKKYLVYFGQNPSIHPELPRIQLGKSTGSSIGEQLPSEVVLTVSFGTNSTAPANSVKFMVESLGVYSPTFKSLIGLKIKHVSKETYDAKILEIENANTSLEGRVEVLEAKGFSNGSVVVGAELGFIDLDKEYSKLLFVSVGRAPVHENEDFTVSVVAGKTRLTWIGSLANPSGAEKIETGDKVFWTGTF